MADLAQDEATRAAATERSRALTEKANALRAESKWEEALPVCIEAHRADPNNPAAAFNLGVMLAKVGRLEEGERLIRHTRTLAPREARVVHSLAHILMGQGRYREAWPLYEIRQVMPELNIGFPKGFDFPRWHGEPLAGKRLAIFPEQGLGDQLQLARFLPRLIAEAAEVILLAVPPLVRLFQHNFPGATIVEAAGNTEFPDPDYWVTFQGIPAAIDLALEDVPVAPYLRAPFAGAPLGDGFKIGLKTIGNPSHANDKARSLSPELADRLRKELPGKVISLEPQDLRPRDMAETAAVIDQLDLVVSVDTSIGHLAGAMGKRCLLLVPGFGTDWRWMVDRADSPWYSNHSLYRSTIGGDWTAAIDRLIADADPAHARAVYQSGHAGMAEAEALLARLFPHHPNPQLEPALRRQAGKKLMMDAQALRAEGKPLEALATIEQAVAVDPDSVDAAYMHGVYLTNCGRLEESEAIMRRVIAAAPGLPNPRDALGNILLAQGRYREAWPLYEARVEREGLNDGYPRTFPYPRWQGQDLDGKHIVIFPEQGFGDQIQFVRFVPRLEKLGAKVTLLAPPPLAALFRHNLPQIEVLTAEGSVDFPDPDYWATLADLPVRMDVQPSSLWDGAYLKPPRLSGEPTGGAFRIGLMAQGNPGFANDLYRSLPPELAARLQRELPGEIIDLSPESTGAKDFADTAAIIDTLDLIVSVDTAVAHLAGAMGKSCLLMLPGYGTDWRWMRGRKDSPWYGDHVLYRTEVGGGWEPVVDQVVRDVRNASKSAFRYLRQASALRAEGRYSESLAAGRKAIAADPDNKGALHNVGRLLADLGRLKEAEKLQRRVLALSQDDMYQYGLSLNLLTQGRYHEAWPLYESRTRIALLRTGFPQGLKFPRWRGEDIAGKRIAIFPEQGFGDQMQFARFLPHLQERCGEIVLLAPPALVRLFETAFPHAQVIKAAGAAEFPRSDVWTSIVELAHLFDARLEALPPPELLHIERTRAADGRFRIGFMGKGNPGFVHDVHRSLPQEAAERLRAALPGEVVDLDPKVSGAKDFLDTARIVADLDLVVSVDTSVGHLAGIMGKPCALLVNGFATDWRWLRDRSDSPWYPRHRIFRGGMDGNWDAAIADLLAHAEALAAHAAALPS